MTVLLKISNFIRQEQGATAVEYGVMLALIIGVAFAAISFFGSENANVWSNNAQAIDNAVSS